MDPTTTTRLRGILADPEFETFDLSTKEEILRRAGAPEELVVDYRRSKVPAGTPELGGPASLDPAARAVGDEYEQARIDRAAESLRQHAVPTVTTQLRGAAKGLGGTVARTGAFLAGGELDPEIAARLEPGPAESFGYGVEQAAEFALPTGAGAAAKLLKLGPKGAALARAGGEAVKGFGLTKAHGGTTGEALVGGGLGALIPGGQGARRALGDWLQKRGRVSMLKALGLPRTPDMEAIAGRLLEEGGMVGGTEKLLGKAGGRLERVRQAQRAAATSEELVDIGPAVKEVEARAKAARPAVPEIDLTVEGGGTGALSAEELSRAARGERYYAVSRGGDITYLGSQPDPARLRPGQGVVRVAPGRPPEVSQAASGTSDSLVLDQFNRAARREPSLLPPEVTNPIRVGRDLTDLSHLTPTEVVQMIQRGELVRGPQGFKLTPEGLINRLQAARSSPEIQAAIRAGEGKPVRSGYPGRQKALESEAQNLRAFQESFPESKVPMSRASVMREQLGARAEAGGAYNPRRTHPLAPGTEAAAVSRGELSEALHTASPALAKADEAYHTYSVVKDALKDALAGSTVSGAHIDRFSRYMGARAILSGGVVAGSPQAGAGIATAALVARMAEKPLWNTLSATAKANLGRFIQSGEFGAALRLLQIAVDRRDSGR